MKSLSGEQILNIWERGQRQHPIDRALICLQVADPETSLAKLAELTIGQRDLHLLTLREKTFGSRFSGYTNCSQCHDRLEFELNVSDIRTVAPQAIAADYSFALDDLEVQFRLPNSWDLAAIANCQQVATARVLLAQRCLLRVERQGRAVSELPMAAIGQLAEQMAQCDPQAEILLNLACPACGQACQVLFDIASFFWSELAAQAKRLLREVHLLARTYGWREADILGMSATRRQLYLEWVSE